MLFNSISFFIFLPVVFILYWFVFNKSLRWQNILIVFGSYVFYGWWDWRFLGLILFSTVVDFLVGLQLGKTEVPNHRKFYLFLSLFVNLGLLGFFKYYHFFIDSWVEVWGSMGVSMDHSTLQIILPVGISFYTFQTLSYSIDVYRKQLQPTTDFIQFAAYVSFFPQLVAGPIERATKLLPQFERQRAFDAPFAWSGVSLMVWGLFKKVVVADTCAYFVNHIFEAPEAHNSLTLFLGAVLFAIQIYGDFSGYSDIAIGTARLFGFELMTNFRFPYFSRDIAEFWRRWHISLSTWFRDYLYIPLGGSRGGIWSKIRNVFVVFLVSGLWHGANWTFLAWGGIHALLFLPLFVFGNHRTYVADTAIRFRHLGPMVFTCIMVTLAWVFFRAHSLPEALTYLKGIFEFRDVSLDFFLGTSKRVLFGLILVVGSSILFGLEYVAVQKERCEVQLAFWQLVCMGLLIAFMGMFKNPETFIYFQF